MALKEKVPATQTFFTYRAPQDGEYWFNVVTVDRGGRSIPADVSKEAPGLIVVIDSTPPQVEVQFVGTTPEGQQVRCEVRDANPDPVKTRFSYQTRDKIWRPLEATAAHTDTFCIPGQAALSGMIRVSVTDMAGNTSTREVNLSALPVVANTPAANTAGASPKLPANVQVIETPGEVFVTSPADLVGGTPKVPSTVVISEKVVPFNDRVEFITNKPSPPPLPAPSLADSTPKAPFAAPPALEMKPAVEIGATAPLLDVPANRHVVNNPHVFLDYQVEQQGVSGVGRVEVWYTRDQGKTWLKLSEDNQRKGQAEVDLPGEGLYGVTVVVSNGRGFGATPPQAGDAPDSWIEVDTTKPRAELLGVRSNPNGDDGSLHITWTAKDKNLRPEPVDLFYAVNRQGPWLPIAKGVKNDGLYRWTPTANVGSHVHIRLTVHDQAGNSTSSETLQPVALDDLSRPRGRVVGITTSPRPPHDNLPAPLPPQGN